MYDGSISAGVSGSRYGFGVLAEYAAGEGDCLIAISGFSIGVDDYGDEGHAVACGGSVDGTVFKCVSGGA